MLELFTRPRIWHKLTALVALTVIPVAFLLYYFIKNSNTQTARIDKEFAGMEFLVPSHKLLEHLMRHRGLSGLVIAGDDTKKGDLELSQSQADADFAVLDAVERKSGSLLALTAVLQDMKQEWNQIKGKGLDEAYLENFNHHNKVISALLAKMVDVGDRAELELDGDIDSYYLGQAVTLQSPGIIDSFGQLRGLGARLALDKKVTINDQVQMATIVAAVNRFNGRLKSALETAFASNPTLEEKLGESYRAARASGTNFQRLAEADFVKAASGNIDANTYWNTGNAAVNSYYALDDKIIAVFDDLLKTRRADLIAKQRNQLLVSFGAFALAALLAFTLSRGITKQVNSITGLFATIGLGDFNARAQVASTDELGEVAEGLNSMLDSTVGLMQSREERDQIQESVEKLTTEISAVAEGDLTQEVEVGPSVTAPVAASVNQMIGELRRIIAQVQTTTLEVSSSANEVQQTTESLASGSEAQSMQIVDASAAIDEMAQSIQKVSHSAASAAGVAEQALSSAKEGTESVQMTIEGMQSIRNQVQQTSKRIKRLGESSQEIGEIVKLISDIADRTSILALNASIQAATAGEAGKGFAVVASEVERLADRSTEATKRIGTLIKSIQTETNEAIAAMEETTREVVGGSSLANSAGEKLGQIESVSNQLAALIQSISSAAQQQSRGSESVAKSMGEISGVTKKAAVGAKVTAASIRQLADRADELRDSLSRFKLPETAGVR